MGFIANNTALILTGITTSIVGGYIFYAGNNGILAGGSYTSKEQSLGLLIGRVLLVGAFTPPIHYFWKAISLQINFLAIAGIIIVIGTYAMNEMVANWRHDTEKSLVLFGAGLLLFIIGMGWI
ncbi:MAG: hypothetical protein ABEJ56_00265 [Candidatus Nanohaloarchaea archaeon]